MFKKLFVLYFSFFLGGAIFAQSVIKSATDGSQYKIITLENGLKALLVSDPKSLKSTAAMAVQVGSLSDGDVLGLAHFNEHMLFLGTKKYPIANEYSQYIEQHNGGLNAFTGLDKTVFFFSIEPGYFSGALDRFGQFFIEPLFNQEYVDRELNAINAEHSRNLSFDSRRVYEVSKLIFKPDFQGAKFNTGNRETLISHKDLRQRLLDYYNTHYSSNKMTLTVVDVKPLEQLEKEVRDLFSAVPQKEVKDVSSDSDVFNRDNLQTLTSIKTIKDDKNLTLEFPVPNFELPYYKKVGAYLGELIGYEGQGSILQALKDKGWANGLSAGFFDDMDQFKLFSIEVSLTNSGAENIDSIIAAIFKYVDLVKSSGVTMDRFDEQAEISKISFDYKEKEDPESLAISTAINLPKAQDQDILFRNYAYRDFDPKLINTVLNEINLNNFYAFYSGPDVKGDKIEPWYNTSFKTQKVSEAELKRIESLKDKFTLTLPEKNKYIAKNLNYFQNSGGTPKKIFSDAKVDFWFNQNDQIQLPKAFFKLRFYLPAANDSILDSLKTDIYLSYVNEKLNTILYPARQAGLFYGLSNSQRGIDIYLDGFNDGMQTLLETIFNEMQLKSIDSVIFNKIVQNYKKSLANIPLSGALDKAYNQFGYLKTNPSWYYKAKQENLSKITKQGLLTFTKSLFNQAKVLAYMHGNNTNEQAIGLADFISAQKFYHEFKPGTKLPELTIAQLDKGENDFIDYSINSDSALAAQFQSDRRTLSEEANAKVLSKILNDNFYYNLRTNEQFGYVVHASAYSLFGLGHIEFVVQSPVKSALEISNRLNKFTQDFTQSLQEINSENLDSIKQALISEIKKDPQDLNTWADEYWSDIVLERSDFSRGQNIIGPIEKVSKESLMDFWQRNIFDNQRQIKFWVLAKGSKKPNAVKFIENLPQYKNRLSFITIKYKEIE